jgi:26S proteasome regulatory subunit T3
LNKLLITLFLIIFCEASFIRVVGSEFVQKYLGEGPRMVRDVFRLAKENSPAIIFIDEIDAIATKRFDAQTGADREVQRILLELLNQMDGFDQTVNVKVIMATNRADTLDPALLRPGRLDRKIEFPLPDRRQKRLVFSTITSRMNLSEEVDLEDYVARPDKISGADINAICQEVRDQDNLHSIILNNYYCAFVHFQILTMLFLYRLVCKQ